MEVRRRTAGNARRGEPRSHGKHARMRFGPRTTLLIISVILINGVRTDDHMEHAIKEEQAKKIKLKTIRQLKEILSDQHIPFPASADKMMLVRLVTEHDALRKFERKKGVASAKKKRTPQHRPMPANDDMASTFFAGLDRNQECAGMR